MGVLRSGCITITNTLATFRDGCNKRERKGWSMRTWVDISRRLCVKGQSNLFLNYSYGERAAIHAAGVFKGVLTSLVIVPEHKHLRELGYPP